MRPKKHQDAPLGGDKSHDAADKPKTVPNTNEDETSEDSDSSVDREDSGDENV